MEPFGEFVIVRCAANDDGMFMGERPTEGSVVAVGPGVCPMKQLEPGDRIAFAGYAITIRKEAGGTRLLAVHEQWIVARLPAATRSEAPRAGGPPR